jgi:glycine cleavage system H protein
MHKQEIQMSDLPKNLKYATSHEWAQLENDNVVRVGITDFAQQQLGDLVFVELPELGRKVKAQDQCAVVESVKTASDLYSPVSGEIIAINDALADEPERVNDDPYKTWIFCVKADDLAGLDKLMGADAYQKMIEN